MILTVAQTQFINQVLEEGSWKTKCPFIAVSTDYMIQSVILWNPLAQIPIKLTCPLHGAILKDHGLWTHKNGLRISPRLLYNIRGNMLLVSALYLCQTCGREGLIRAHDVHLMKQVRGTLNPNFHLFARSGCTQETFETIINCIQSGMTFNETSNFFKRSFGLAWPNPNYLKGDLKFNSPSGRHCEDIFLHHYRNHLSFYESEMLKVIPSDMSMDHTFYSSNLVHIRDGESTKTQFSALFLVLDEAGRVISFCLTKTKSLEEVVGHLRELHSRAPNAKFIHTDNCCADKRVLLEVFGEGTNVRLDIFHAMNRISRKIKKKQLTSRKKKLFHRQLRLVFRQKKNQSGKRILPTPLPSELTKRLDDLKKHWQKELPQEAVKEITNLTIHAKRGCLSGIPCGQGTTKNENVHRHVNTFLRGRTHLGAETLVALLHSFFFRWNCRLKGEDDTHSSARAEHHKGSNPVRSQLQFGLPGCFTAQSEEQEQEEDNIENVPRNGTSIVQSQGSLGAEHNSVIKDVLTLIDVADNMSINSLSLCQEDVVLSSQYSSLPKELCEQNDCLRSHYARIDQFLRDFSLQRVQISQDGDCLFKAMANQMKQIDQYSEYGQFIEQCSISLVDSVDTLAELFRKLVVTELSANYRLYMAYTKKMKLTDYRRKVQIFGLKGQYAGDLGDLLLPALTNVLRTTVTVICSSPLNPVLHVLPDKGALNNKPMYVTYLTFGPGHYDGTLPLSQNSGGSKSKSQARKVKKCHCGQKGNDGCISNNCPCFQQEQSCQTEPRCKCQKCGNKFGTRNEDENINYRPCRCGQNMKTDRGVYTSCFTTKCPCIRLNKSCAECKCKGCANPQGQPDKKQRQIKQIQRPRQSAGHGGKLQRATTRQFLERNHTSTVTRHWTLRESILLNEIVRRQKKSGKLSLERIAQLYNGAIQLESTLGSKKTERQIQFKLRNLSKKCL
jgi:hypothetical protein